MTYPQAPWQFGGNHKRPKRGGDPVPGNPHPFPKTVGIILSLISLWNYPVHKNKQPHSLGPLAFWDGPHSVYGVCISLSKSAFALLWLTLEFLHARSQGPSLGGSSQGLARDLQHHHVHTYLPPLLMLLHSLPYRPLLRVVKLIKQGGH